MLVATSDYHDNHRPATEADDLRTNEGHDNTIPECRGNSTVRFRGSHAKLQRFWLITRPNGKAGWG